VCPEECDHPSPAPPAAVRRDTIRMRGNETENNAAGRSGDKFSAKPRKSGILVLYSTQVFGFNPPHPGVIPAQAGIHPDAWPPPLALWRIIRMDPASAGVTRWLSKGWRQSHRLWGMASPRPLPPLCGGGGPPIGGGGGDHKHHGRDPSSTPRTHWPPLSQNRCAQPTPVSLVAPSTSLRLVPLPREGAGEDAPWHHPAHTPGIIPRERGNPSLELRHTHRARRPELDSRVRGNDAGGGGWAGRPHRRPGLGPYQA